MVNNGIPGMAVTYVQSTREHVSALTFGPSRHGENYIHSKYMWNGKEIEHNAAFDTVLFPVRSPSPSPSKGSSTRLATLGHPGEQSSHSYRVCITGEMRCPWERTEKTISLGRDRRVAPDKAGTTEVCSLRNSGSVTQE